MSVRVQPVWILNVQVKKKTPTTPDQTQLIVFNPTFNKQSMSPEMRVVCSTLSSWEQILLRIQRWITVVGSDLFPAHVYMPSSHIPLLTACLHASHMWCLHVKRIRMAVKAQSSHGHRSLCHRLVHNSFPVTLSSHGRRHEVPVCRLCCKGSVADGRWEGFMFTCWILKARLVTVYAEDQLSPLRSIEQSIVWFLSKRSRHVSLSAAVRHHDNTGSSESSKTGIHH